MMQMTSHGQLPRPAMQCSYAAWSRAKLKISLKLRPLIGSEGLVPKDMSLKIARIKAKILPSEIEMSKIWPVNFSTKVHACTLVLMKQEALSIDISVLHALQKRPFLMHRKIAKTNTKIKKQVNFGVSLHIGTCFGHRIGMAHKKLPKSSIMNLKFLS